MQTLILLALLPTAPALREKATATEKRAQNRHNTTVIQACLAMIFSFLVDASNTGLLIQCPDGNFRTCYPVLAAWCADHEEKVNSPHRTRILPSYLPHSRGKSYV